ncbi:von Willebrand factor [Pyrenophora tritici-repentis]|uniref:von Willebrand factor n=2 Tax=Pyrenophora tritici-repentis TaxID=45151 RepID=A0A2W1F9Y8_9PLEO|nr:von Willebrand factor [Pyrenophora tritici-repentis Pt-1C-BFP]KAA8621120.1 von Willebrand factor [Pyrenophora tritici-repentis]EDU43521.1 von Willebrand factor [Pyrenophora tritici-repentis Pt-1C-BFP]KAF7450363.1 von Willebrand factor [Pyrenophora tritici-repentis]KAF7572966.1 von Willebrand factor [Pyrenophora tritici-repentis]KAG9381413.1 von Willebrand factor [Pyrenophora tritici-repentis]
MKRALTTRKSSSSTDYPSQGTESAGHTFRNTPAVAPISTKRTGSRNGSLVPPSPMSPLSPASPATRRPGSSNMYSSNSNNEAPPAYSPGPVGSSNALQPISGSAQSDADEYAFLCSFDTVFLIDDSGSMAGRSWRETGKALELITPICTERDKDGIDIYFLNHPDSSIYKNITRASTIIEIFQTVRPSGYTPTGQRLNQILKPYLKRYEKNDKIKPINIIVITDGAPSDDVESPIIQAAKKLDKLEAPAWQVGIQFFQVGSEKQAREHLKMLDDGLAELSKDSDLRDIVDTVPFTDDHNGELTASGILKVVLGSVNRRLDRNSLDLHKR